MATYAGVSSGGRDDHSPRVCDFEGCGKTVQASRGRSNYCSDECRYAKRNLNLSRRRAAARAKDKRVCGREGCSKLVSDKRKQAGGKFCSARCQDLQTRTTRKRATAAKREGKKCKHCGKPLDAQRTTKEFCGQTCIDKFNYAADPEGQKARAREWHLMNLYGRTVDDWDMLLASQGGVCAICQQPPDPHRRRFAVDHDHETGEVRGLLCGNCNRGIGHFNDDPDLISVAIDYVEKHR